MGDPAWVYGAGQANTSAEGTASAAKDRAIRDLAVQICANVSSAGLIEEREHNGVGDVRVEDRVEVQAIVKGLEGIEETEREVRGTEACVVVRLARSTIEAKKTRDRAMLSKAATLLKDAQERCATDTLRMLDTAEASLEGICPGLLSEARSVAEVQAAIGSARRRATAGQARDAELALVSTICGDEPCPVDINSAAKARLSADGVKVGDGPCAGKKISLELVVEGSGERALQTATEYTASVRARWILTEGETRTGNVAKASGGGYSKHEAFIDAATKALERAPLP